MTGETTKILTNNALPPPSIVQTNPNGESIPIVVNNNNNNNNNNISSSNSKSNSKNERGKAFRQVIAAIVANLGIINTGLIFGFSAVAIPQLQSKDSLITLDINQASWVASLSSAATPFGCILGGYLMDRIGRKKTLLITEVPMIIGWLTIAFAVNIELIYLGRILTGIGSGMVGAPARVYTSEVTQPHLRGMLCALASVSISFGVLFQYTLGAFLTWQVLSGISASVPIFAFVFMILMPESPNYLVSKSKPEKAVKSLTKLRGSNYNVQKEVDNLQDFVNKSNTNKKKLTFKETLDALLCAATLKPFGILVLYFMMYQFSGVNVITFYTVQIFRDSGTTIDNNTCTIMLGAVRLLFTVIGCGLCRRCGRRPLTFISSIGCGISMIGLGTYLYYKLQWDSAVPPIAPSLTWFPVLCIFAFTITCTLGFLVVPWLMIGELYPLKVRGIVGGLTTCTAHIFVFIVVKTYPFLSTVLYRHGAFILYGCISLIGTIYFYFCLPETKGRSLQEIEDYFSGRTTSMKAPKVASNFNLNLQQVSMIQEKEKDKLLNTT